MRARFAMGIVSSIFLWLAPPPRGERVASCGDSIKCTNENGWRYFRACGMERNVHWWRYDFESLAYPAMAALGPHARRILVLGGASGGVASRFLQSSDVEEVRWVSNLNGVMEAARRCVPSVSGIDEDPRLRVEMLNSTQFLYQNPANKAVMQYDIIVQDTLSLFAEEHGLGRHFWSASLETEYFSSSRLEVLQKMLSSRGVLVLTAGYLTTPKFLQIAQGALSTFHNRWTLQFAAPDVAHATGVTIGFVAGGIEATMKMNRSWWQLQGIETCFYTEDMHRALLTPSLTLLKVLGLTVSSEPSSSLPKMAAAELPQVSRQTCGYEDQEFQLLETERTNFQTVQVTRALSFAGDSECVTLFLDGELQLTDVYGDVYHEALVHVMMASLGPSPLRKVLVLGGGDGGVATVALKYPMVELLQVEIDERVIQMSKRFFPHFSAAFTDQRHKLVVGDAVRWVEDHAHEMQSTFDLCIIDSTDEPLESVWSISFYQRLKSMLTPHGAIVQNIGSQTDLLADFRSLHQPVFQKRYLINCLTPDYESPYFLSILADTDLKQVNWSWWSSLNISTTHYHPSLHETLLAIPRESLNFYIDGQVWTPHDEKWSRDFFSARVLPPRSAREL